MNLINAWKVVSSNQITKMLEAVRNKLLAAVEEDVPRGKSALSGIATTTAKAVAQYYGWLT